VRDARYVHLISWISRCDSEHWLFHIRKINLIGQTVEGSVILAGHYKIVMAGLEETALNIVTLAGRHKIVTAGLE
jgi:hypothetical protein